MQTRTNSVKDKLIIGIRMFGVEVIISQNQAAITSYIQAYLQNMTAKDIIKFITEGIPFPVTDDIIDLLKGYEEVIKIYTPYNATQMFLEQMHEARPDLFVTILSFGYEGAIWSFNSTKLVYDKVLSTETTEIKKINKVSVTCSICSGELLVDEDKIANIKTCPFCGNNVVHEKPPEQSVPVPLVEEKPEVQETLSENENKPE